MLSSGQVSSTLTIMTRIVVIVIVIIIIIIIIEALTVTDTLVWGWGVEATSTGMSSSLRPCCPGKCRFEMSRFCWFKILALELFAEPLRGFDAYSRTTRTNLGQMAPLGALGAQSCRAWCCWRRRRRPATNELAARVAATKRKGDGVGTAANSAGAVACSSRAACFLSLSLSLSFASSGHEGLFRSPGRLAPRCVTGL